MHTSIFRTNGNSSRCVCCIHCVFFFFSKMNSFATEKWQSLGHTNLSGRFGFCFCSLSISFRSRLISIFDCSFFVFANLLKLIGLECSDIHISFHIYRIAFFLFSRSFRDTAHTFHISKCKAFLFIL